jgi:hypothetical protein
MSPWNEMLVELIGETVQARDEHGRGRLPQCDSRPVAAGECPRGQCPETGVGQQMCRLVAHSTRQFRRSGNGGGDEDQAGIDQQRAPDIEPPEPTAAGGVRGPASLGCLAGSTNRLMKRGCQRELSGLAKRRVRAGYRRGRLQRKRVHQPTQNNSSTRKGRKQDGEQPQLGRGLVAQENREDRRNEEAEEKQEQEVTLHGSPERPYLRPTAIS